jgi:hypothetical protein
MGNAVRVLGLWAKEFIPALKVECLIVGWGLVLMSICLIVVATTSGLTGSNTYMILHPGLTIPGIIAGLALVGAALTMKPVPREEM